MQRGQDFCQSNFLSPPSSSLSPCPVMTAAFGMAAAASFSWKDLRCFAALLCVCRNLFCPCNAAPFLPLLFISFDHHPEHEPAPCQSFMEHTGERNELAFVQLRWPRAAHVGHSAQCWNVLLGLSLKCFSVGIHFLHVVWHEKLLVVAFALAWWGWCSLRPLCSAFPAVKGVNSSLLGWLRLLRGFCLFHWFWLKTKNI